MLKELIWSPSQLATHQHRYHTFHFAPTNLKRAKRGSTLNDSNPYIPTQTHFSQRHHPIFFLAAESNPFFIPLKAPYIKYRDFPPLPFTQDLDFLRPSNLLRRSTDPGVLISSDESWLKPQVSTQSNILVSGVVLWVPSDLHPR